jgi:hypothetical protein
VNGDDTQKKIDALIRRYKPRSNMAALDNGSLRESRKQPIHFEDQEVLDKCRDAQNAAKFADLFDQGDVDAYHNGDASRADLALMSMLAFYTQDPDQLERLFSASALGQRKKWQQRHEYRRMTVEKALSELKETYRGAEVLELGGALVSSLSPPIGKSDDNDTKTYKSNEMEDNEDEPEVIWFHELGEPKEREYLIAQIGVKGYPIIVFGAGGVAKSFGVLSAGVAIASASGLEDWLGMRVLEHGYVLYLDFELDVDEQHRRVRDLCNGFGIPTPKRLAYVSGVGITVAAAFRRAGKFAKEYEPKAIIIDSLGLALEGDMERGKDVLAFYRKYIDPFRRMGVTPIIVDHEGKLQTGEKHKHKSPIGSAYKAWAARNVLQFELEEYDKENSILDIRVRQTKTNFAPVDPFGVRFVFEEKKVSITSRALPDTELVEEERIPMKDRIIGALRAGPATNVELQKFTGAGDGTIRNKLSELIQAGVVVADDGRPKTYRLADELEVSLSSPPSIGDDSDDTSDESQNYRIEEF